MWLVGPLFKKLYKDRVSSNKFPYQKITSQSNDKKNPSIQYHQWFSPSSLSSLLPPWPPLLLPLPVTLTILTVATTLSSVVRIQIFSGPVSRLLTWIFFLVVGLDSFPATAAYTNLARNKLGVNIAIGTEVWSDCNQSQGQTWYGRLSFEQILCQILTTDL